jgi:hypothetical protein
MASIHERLEFDPDRDLERLLRGFRQQEIGRSPSGMRDHFRVARRKPRGFRDHPPLLAISLGGTTTKLMLATMRDNHLVVHYARSFPNPTTPTQYQEYLDQILIGEPEVADYLRNNRHTYMGFSVPVQLVEGVPYNKTKVPHLNGLIARNIPEDAPTHHLETNVQSFLRSHGIRPVCFFTQGDGIVAHHGGVSLCRVGAQDKTVLLVCGTGLATGDEEYFILIGTLKTLPNDPQLYPASETENGQYQYAVAGKGLFSFLDRIVRIRSRESGSPLQGVDLHRYFRCPADSRTVVEIWESSRDGSRPAGTAAAIAADIGTSAYEELQYLTSKVMSRVVASLANCCLATIASMGPAASGRGHIVFLEGGIALNPYVLPLLRADILKRARNSKLFESQEMTPPIAPNVEPALFAPQADNSLTNGALEIVDLTLMGAATGVIAEHYLRDGP